MKNRHVSGGKTILLTFIVAFMLTILPLPSFLQTLRPEFVVIVLIYWSIALPERIGVGTGWSVGLVLDVLTDALLGQHALTLALVTFLAIKLHQRIRVFPVWQQAVTIFVLMTFQATITLWIKGVLGEASSFSEFMWPAFTTALFWPAGYLLMRQVRRFYRVY